MSGVTVQTASELMDAGIASTGQMYACSAAVFTLLIALNVEPALAQ